MLKCIAGMFGFFICITTDIPEAQNVPFLPAPGILFFISFENLPLTSEKFTPTFSNILPF